MGQLATPLALAELVGTIAIAVLLAVALLWKRQVLPIVLVAAVVFGVVFANPLAVVAKPAPADARSLTPSDEADGARHWVKVAGIPVAWFTPYDQLYPWAGMFENSSNSVLKLRYGLSFLPSTGATTVTEQCDNSTFEPCWRDRRDSYALVRRDDAGRAYVVPLTQTLVPNRQGESGSRNVPHVYEVRLGVAWRGVVYWLVVLAAVALAASTRRLRVRSVATAFAACVVVGIVAAGALAVVPAPERDASGVTPELLPEPAQPPTATGPAEIRPLENVEPSCVRRISGTTVNMCGRVDRLTASRTADGILAVWTAEANGFMHLRTRRMSSRGRPLDTGSTTIRSWSQTDAAGNWNCEVPAELQATPIVGGEVLVAWSSACDLRGGTGGAATITGAVLSPSGRMVHDPFPVLGYDRGSTAWPAPRYWLRSTAAGDAVLMWEAPTRARYYGRALFVSKLSSDLRAGNGRELLYGEHGIGSVAVACATSCLVAQGIPDGVTLRLIDLGGLVLRRERVPRGPTSFRSELVAGADRTAYSAGWLESDGTNVDGYLATLPPAGDPVVRNVASSVPAGDGTSSVAPDPLGVAVDRTPALVFQTPTLVEGQFLLHVASLRAISTTSTNVRLGEATVLGDVLIAIAGQWSRTPAEPASVLLR